MSNTNSAKVITPLDRAWARKETRKLIREGKVRLSNCKICGSRKVEIHHLDYDDPSRVIWLCSKHHKQAHHIDYSEPEHVRWLCKRHKSEESISELQRELLKDALRAFYHTPL